MSRLDFAAVIVLVVFAFTAIAIYVLKGTATTVTACEARGGVLVNTPQGNVCAKLEVLK